uniref:Uncharacterized protein n=1 Tax=Pithovirus LCPAC001 TaxID=2506585 RepID=A0A481Z1C3_9VIRU|nr:MAG: hypothetical protein LCPAC001_00120 [Pithovirus LCPAC001]
MSYKRDFGVYNKSLAIVENDTSKYKLSDRVISNIKFILRELQKFKTPIAYSFEGMSDDSVRMEWWNRKTIVKNTRGLYLDVFSDNIIITLVHGVSISSEVFIKFSSQTLIEDIVKNIENLSIK